MSSSSSRFAVAVHVLALLARAGFPLRTADRGERFPLVIAGGIAVQINPEPVAPFFDLALVGEGEELVAPFVERVLELGGRDLPRGDLLAALAALDGAYVPALYDVAYADTRAPGGGCVTRFEPRRGAPAKVRRASSGVMASTRSDDGLNAPPSSPMVQVSGSSPV